MYKELSDILRWCVRTHKEHTLVHNCFKKSGRKFSLMIIITNEKKKGGKSSLLSKVIVSESHGVHS